MPLPLVNKLDDPSLNNAVSSTVVFYYSDGLYVYKGTKEVIANPDGSVASITYLDANGVLVDPETLTFVAKPEPVIPPPSSSSTGSDPVQQDILTELQAILTVLQSTAESDQTQTILGNILTQQQNDQSVAETTRQAILTALSNTTESDQTQTILTSVLTALQSTVESDQTQALLATAISELQNTTESDQTQTILTNLLTQLQDTTESDQTQLVLGNILTALQDTTEPDQTQAALSALLTEATSVAESDQTQLLLQAIQTELQTNGTLNQTTTTSLSNILTQLQDTTEPDQTQALIQSLITQNLNESNETQALVSTLAGTPPASLRDVEGTLSLIDNRLNNISLLVNPAKWSSGATLGSRLRYYHENIVDRTIHYNLPDRIHDLMIRNTGTTTILYGNLITGVVPEAVSGHWKIFPGEVFTRTSRDGLFIRDGNRLLAEGGAPFSFDISVGTPDTSIDLDGNV